MFGFVFVRDVKLGDLLTAGSVLLATLAFVYGMLKDRRMRRREYADRIRNSASETLAAIERWREIALRHFHDAQPLLTDADVMLVKDQDVIIVRDYLWRALVSLEVQSSTRVLSEKLEGAYAGLYGYDPSVQTSYSSSVANMRQAFETAHVKHLETTQQDVLSMDAVQRPFTSALLGNRLRETTSNVIETFLVHSEEALAPLRSQLLTLIEA